MQALCARVQGLSGDSPDLALDRAVGLVLHDDGSRGHLVTRLHVSDRECNEIAPARLAVDAEAEECKLADTAFHLKTQGPDVLNLKGSHLPDDFALVSRYMMNDIACGFRDGLPSS